MLQLYQGLELVANRHFSQPARSRPCVQAEAAKKQKPKKRKPKQPLSQRISYVDDAFDGDVDGDSALAADIRLVPATHVPKAPEPKAGSRNAAMEPEDLYPVFPKQPKPVENLSAAGSKWSWGDDSASESGQKNPPERLWNPRTGFMRTRAELEQEQAAANANISKSVSRPQQPVANSSSSSDVVERLPVTANPLQPPSPPWPAAAEQLPAVGRGQVLLSCTLTAGAMTAAAVGLSLLATKQSAALFGTAQADIEHLLQLPAGLQTPQQAGVMLAAAAVVTAARLLLKERWADFREASDRSNQQVLSSLNWPDVAVVALLSGVSEELLFRWAMVAGTWPDIRGVVFSGALFGVLHVGGGRNAAFATWAAAVGWLYGGAFLATGNVWVPAGAHALANFVSAAMWIKNNPQAKQQTQ